MTRDTKTRLAVAALIAGAIGMIIAAATTPAPAPPKPASRPVRVYDADVLILPDGRIFIQAVRPSGAKR